MDAGTDPVNKLLPRSMSDNEELYPISRGMEPEMELTDRYRLWRVESSPSSGGSVPERLAEGSWRERRWRDGSFESEIFDHWGDEISVHVNGDPSVKTHFSPRHWQSGTEVFHEFNNKFSVSPWIDGLILLRSRSTSVEMAKVKKKKKKEKIGDMKRDETETETAMDGSLVERERGFRERERVWVCVECRVFVGICELL